MRRPLLPSLLPATERGTGVRYYGWRIVVFAAVCLGMTAPGQTAGVSVFIDPMMDGLGLSRTAVSSWRSRWCSRRWRASAGSSR